MKVNFEVETATDLSFRDNCEIYLATFDKPDDRLLFKIKGKTILVMNLKELNNEVVLQEYNAHYSDQKRISKLEIKAILEAN